MSPAAAARSLPKTPRGQRTRGALLDAAERCFAGKGFHDTAVADITDAAGIGFGTFYLYFEDKKEIFRAVISSLQDELREALRGPVSGDRIAHERLGVRTFLDFAQERPELFKILQEAYLVDPDIYLGYFEDIAVRYAAKLRVAQEAGEVARGDPDIQAWCLMAVSNFLGLRYAHAAPDPAEREAIVNTAADFVAFGLAPRGPEQARGPARPRRGARAPERRDPRHER